MNLTMDMATEMTAAAIFKMFSNNFSLPIYSSFPPACLYGAIGRIYQYGLCIYDKQIYDRSHFSDTGIGTFPACSLHPYAITIDILSFQLLTGIRILVHKIEEEPSLILFYQRKPFCYYVHADLSPVTNKYSPGIHFLRMIPVIMQPVITEIGINRYSSNRLIGLVGNSLKHTLRIEVNVISCRT